MPSLNTLCKATLQFLWEVFVVVYHWNPTQIVRALLEKIVMQL